jgi:hypothetical protein
MSVLLICPALTPPGELILTRPVIVVASRPSPPFSRDTIGKDPASTLQLESRVFPARLCVESRSTAVFQPDPVCHFRPVEELKYTRPVAVGVKSEADTCNCALMSSP